MAADATTAGFFIGGAVGAAAAYFLSRRGAEEGDDAGPGLDLARYKSLSADAALAAALTEPVHLLFSLDRPETLALLQNFDDLCAAYTRCRLGDAKPSLVAEALAARRLASARLAALTRRARQERAILASELAEDFEALKKALADYIYNINQEHGLQRLNA